MAKKSRRFHSAVAKAVIKVDDGRGFMIRYRKELPPFQGKRMFTDERLVVTAAHCLPKFLPCHPASFWHERTYKDLLGAIGDPKQDVCAECVFVDPIADIAVLGCPNDEELDEEADRYRELTKTPQPFWSVRPR